MAEKSVDDVFAEILKDSRSIAVEVIESSAKKAQTDIMLKAYELLKKYYKNFGTPKQYKRTYQLRKSIVPIMEGRTKKGSEDVSIRIGVEYDSAQLEGLYHSNSKFHQSGDKWVSRYDSDFSWDTGDNGIPEPDWILNNFLKGEHVWGSEPDQRKQDSESTNRLMKKFINKDIDIILNRYVRDALINALQRRL